MILILQVRKPSPRAKVKLVRGEVRILSQQMDSPDCDDNHNTSYPESLSAGGERRKHASENPAAENSACILIQLHL